MAGNERQTILPGPGSHTGKIMEGVLGRADKPPETPLPPDDDAEKTHAQSMGRESVSLELIFKRGQRLAIAYSWQVAVEFEPETGIIIDHPKGYFVIEGSGLETLFKKIKDHWCPDVSEDSSAKLEISAIGSPKVTDIYQLIVEDGQDGKPVYRKRKNGFIVGKKVADIVFTKEEGHD